MNFKVVKAKKGKLENSESNKLFRKRQASLHYRITPIEKHHPGKVGYP